MMSGLNARIETVLLKEKNIPRTDEEEEVITDVKVKKVQQAIEGMK
jgi:hypothetical protein